MDVWEQQHQSDHEVCTVCRWVDGSRALWMSGKAAGRFVNASTSQVQSSMSSSCLMHACIQTNQELACRCDRETSHRGMCNKKAKVPGTAAWPAPPVVEIQRLSPGKHKFSSFYGEQATASQFCLDCSRRPSVLLLGKTIHAGLHQTRLPRDSGVHGLAGK